MHRKRTVGRTHILLVANLLMREQLYVEEIFDNVPLSVLVCRNPLVDDAASHGGQAEESVPQPNENEYYEESKIDEDEDRYDNDYDIPLTLEEWKADFEKKYTESTKRMLYDMRIDMEEINHRMSESLAGRLTQRQDEMSKFLNRG